MTAHSKIEKAAAGQFEKLQDKLSDIMETVTSNSSKAVEKFGQSRDAVVKSAKKHPAIAIATASAVGLLVGFLIKKVK